MPSVSLFAVYSAQKRATTSTTFCSAGERKKEKEQVKDEVGGVKFQAE